MGRGASPTPSTKNIKNGSPPTSKGAEKTMTKRYEMFVELFNNGSHQSYELTRSKATWNKEDGQIEISCEKSPTVFYHLEDVTRIARGLNLSTFAKVEDGKIKIIVF